MALKWYRKAAKQGVPESAHGLANMLKKNGDDAEALEWMTKAADHGVPDALYTLGRWYAEGDGVPKDLSKAKDVSHQQRHPSLTIHHPSSITHPSDIRHPSSAIRRRASA